MSNMHKHEWIWRTRRDMEEETGALWKEGTVRMEEGVFRAPRAVAVEDSHKRGLFRSLSAH